MLLPHSRAAELLEKIRTGEGPIGFDVEGTGLDVYDDHVVGLAIATSTRWACYVPFRHERLLDGTWRPHPLNWPMSTVLLVIKALTESGRPLVMHNAPFDLAMCEKEGWDFPDVKVWDTQVAKWILNRGLFTKLGLKELALADLKVTMIKWHFDGPPGPFSGPIARGDIEEAATYATDDPKRTLQLWARYEEELKANPEFWYCFDALECELLRCMAHMKRWGTPLDVDFLKRVHDDELLPEMATLEKGMNDLVRGQFPVSSPQGISVMMFDDLKWWKPYEGQERGKNGKFSCAEEVVLSQLTLGTPMGKEIAMRLLRWRKLDTLRSRYSISLHDLCSSDGRLRCDFHQTGTVTGRFSSSGPNLQNIPKPNPPPDAMEYEKNLPKIRAAFVASPGWTMIDIDYSQIELVLMAHYSKDPVLLDVYKNGGDVHRTTAEAVGCSRDEAKPINFGLIYGMSAWTLAGTIGVDQEKAQAWYNAYFRRFAGVKRFIERVQRQVERDGYVKTLAGRHRLIPNAQSKDWKKKQGANREAVNTTIQGSAADLIKIAMRNLYKLWLKKKCLNDKVRILLTIHDELLVEAIDSFRDEAAADMQQVFESAVQLLVPLSAKPGFGQNWVEAH